MLNRYTSMRYNSERNITILPGNDKLIYIVPKPYKSSITILENANGRILEPLKSKW